MKVSPQSLPGASPAEPPDVPQLATHIRSMRAMLAVAKHGSTVRAAEAIHLSQSAAARSITELERVCGLSLFRRASRGMVATEPGAHLAERIETTLTHLLRGAAEALAAAPAEARRSSRPDRFPSVVTAAQLRAVTAIASCGRESAAAELLGVTQPAVHATLQGLERSVGVRLFYRLPFGTRLTPAGEALLRRVKLALAEIRAMESDLAAWRGEVCGKIVVGVLPLSVPIFLPRAVEALANRHPDIQVEIVDGTYESLMRQLLGAEVDAIAGALRSDVPDDEVRQLHLFDDDLVVIARKGHPSLRAKGLGLQDLLRWQWVRPLAHTPADRALEQVFRAQRLDPPRASLRAGSPTLTLAFVIQTGLLALASRGQAIVDNQGGQLCIVPVPLPSTMRRIGLTLRAVGAPSHDLQLFLQSCRSTVSGRLEQPVARWSDAAAEMTARRM